MGKAVYECSAEVKRFADWATRAKVYAETHGFATPCGKHEYAVMLQFYDNGIASYKAIQLLIQWRERAR